MPITLRDAAPRDVPAFYAMHADPEANRRGAFIPRKKADFFKHWRKVLKNRLNLKKTIVLDGTIAGYIVSFFRNGVKPKRREIGYWIARKHWGKGLATEALRQLLEIHHTRPLFARVARTNPGSLRVAQKCGFKIVERGSYRNEAGQLIKELVLRLSSRGGPTYRGNRREGAASPGTSSTARARTAR